MFRTKQELDRHVNDILKKAKTEKDKNEKGYQIAKLYVGMKEHVSAKRHLASFLELRDTYAPAHLLMGHLLELEAGSSTSRKEGGVNELARAISHYRRSYELDNSQKSIILKVCSIFVCPDMEVNRARYWLEKGELEFPGHDTVFKLKEKLMGSNRSKGYKMSTAEAEELMQLYAAELNVRPRDVTLRTRLLQLLCDGGRLGEARDHIYKVDRTEAFQHSYLWHSTACHVLEACIKEKTRVTTLCSLLSHLSSLSYLTLKEKGHNEAALALSRLDQALYSSTSAASTAKDPSISHLLAVAQEEAGAQLAFLSASLLLSLTSGQSTARSSRSSVLAAILFFVSYDHLPASVDSGSSGYPLDDTSLDKDSGKLNHMKLVETLRLMGCYRMSQSGHMLKSLKEGVPSKWIDQLKSTFSIKECVEQVYESLFPSTLSGRLTTPQSSYLIQAVGSGVSQQRKGDGPAMNYPSEFSLGEYDSAGLTYMSESLHDHIWLALTQYSLDSPTHPRYEMVPFKSMSCGSGNLSHVDHGSFCKLDVLCFFYAAVRTSALGSADRQLHASSSLLPACLTRPSLCSDQQQAWWCAAYRISHNMAKESWNQMRNVVHRGMEVVRLSGVHGLSSSIVVQTARTLEESLRQMEESQCLGSEFEYGSLGDEVRAYKAWVKLYWSAAAPLLLTLQSNQMLPAPKNALFPTQGTDQSPSERAMEADLEQARMYSALSLVEERKYGGARKILSSLACAEASYQVAQIWKQEYEEEFGAHNRSSVLTSDDHDLRLTFIGKVKEALYLTLDRLQDLPTHKLNSVLAVEIEEIEEKESEARGSLRVGPSLVSTSVSTPSAASNTQPQHRLLGGMGSTPGRGLGVSATPGSLGRGLGGGGSSQSAAMFSGLSPGTPLSAGRFHCPPSPERLSAQMRSLSLAQDGILHRVLVNQETQEALLKGILSELKESRQQQSGKAELDVAIKGITEAAEKLTLSAFNPSPMMNQMMFPQWMMGGPPHHPGQSGGQQPQPHTHQSQQHTHQQQQPGPVPGALYGTGLNVSASTSPQQHPLFNMLGSYPDQQDDTYRGKQKLGGGRQGQPPVMPSLEEEQGYYGDNQDEYYYEDCGDDVGAIAGAGGYDGGTESDSSSEDDDTPAPAAVSAAGDTKPPPVWPYGNVTGTEGKHTVTYSPQGERPQSPSKTTKQPQPPVKREPSEPNPQLPLNVSVGKDCSSESTVGLLDKAASQPRQQYVVHVPKGGAGISSTPPAKPTAAAASTNTAKAGSTFQFNLTTPSVSEPTDRSSSSRQRDGGSVSENESGTLNDSRDPQFQPVIDLPDEVPVITGEEDEEIVFEERAKLYRLSEGQWKERGVGNIRILRDPATGLRRLVMRREHVHKVCLNHRLAAGMKLLPHGDKSTAWMWIAVDFAEDKSEETFAIRFKSSDLAETFQSKFKDGEMAAAAAAASTVRSASPVKNSTPAPAPTAAATGFASLLKATQHMWTCSGCYVQNGPDVSSCPACGKAKPGAVTQSDMPAKPSLFGSTGSTVRFGQLPAAVAPLPSFGNSSGVASTAPNSTNLFGSVGSTVGSGSLFGSTGSTSLSTGFGGKPLFGAATSATLTMPSSSTGTPGGFFGSKPAAPTDSPLLASVLKEPVSSTLTTGSSAGPEQVTSATGGLGGGQLLKQLLTAPSAASNPPASTAPATSSSFQGFSFNRTSATTGSSGFSFNTTKPSGGVDTKPLTFGGLFPTASTPQTNSSSSSGAHTGQSPSDVFGGSPSVSSNSPFAVQKPNAPSAASVFASAVVSPSSASSNPPVATSTASSSTAMGGLFGGGGLSFGSLASSGQAPSFLQPSGTNTSYSGSDQPLFGSSTTPKTPTRGGGGQDGDKSPGGADFEPQVDFKPALETLPDIVEVTTGEEGYKVLFCERSKLFRYDSSSGQWKERGVGDIKILGLDEEGEKTGSYSYRIVMRREQVLKLCANHSISSTMVLSPLKSCDKAWTWHATDFSEGEAKQDALCARFKNTDIGAAFKKTFEECVTFLKSDTGSHKSETGSHSTPAAGAGSSVVKDTAPETKSLSEQFKSKAGEWICSGCSVKNGPEKSTCPCCNTPNPSASSTVPGSSAPTKSLSEQFKSKAGEWICSGCSVKNGPEKSTCPCCNTSNPSASSTVPGSSAPVTSTSVTGVPVPGVTFGKPNPSGTTTSLFAGFGLKTQAPTSSPAKPGLFSGFGGGFGKSAAEVSSSTSGASPATALNLFGRPSSSSGGAVSSTSDAGQFSFGGLANSGSSAATVLPTQATPIKAGSSGAPGGPKSPESPGYYKDDEHDGDHLTFEPVVALPDKVEVITGEEEESVLYCHRAKLYRYVDAEWKERGLGDMKLLKHNQTGKLRFLMRREKVLKICCNQPVSESLQLQPMEGVSGKAWVWFALDYSEDAATDQDGQGEPLKFAIKFKTAEVAAEFKNAVESSLSSTGAPHDTAGPSHPRTGPSASDSDDDDVIFVCEDTVTPEQRKAALDLCLPPFWYTSTEQAGGCPGCLGCEEYEESVLDHLFRGAPFERILFSTVTTAEAGSRQDKGKAATSTQDADDADDAQPKPNAAEVLFTSLGQSDSLPTFASQVATTSELPFQQLKAGFKWAGQGQALFSSGLVPTDSMVSNGDDEEADGAEAAPNEPDFKPVLDQLPDIVVTKTGEEDEEVVFKDWAKLYRFDEDDNSWKERGAGNLKLLKHPQKGTVRVLMRRDQVLKLACNHYLAPSMTLSPLLSSDKALCWTAQDYSHGEVSCERLAARFKTPAQAEAFKQAFTQWQNWTLDEGDAPGPEDGEESGAVGNVHEENGGDSYEEGEENTEQEGEDDDDDEEEEDRVLFTKRATLKYRDPGQRTVSKLGTLTMVYVDDMAGHFIRMYADDEELLANSMVCKETELVIAPGGKTCSWKAADHANDAKYRHFEATLSSTAAMEEFQKYFEEGKVLANEYDLSEADTQTFPTELDLSES